MIRTGYRINTDFSYLLLFSLSANFLPLSIFLLWTVSDQHCFYFSGKDDRWLMGSRKRLLFGTTPDFRLCLQLAVVFIGFVVLSLFFSYIYIFFLLLLHWIGLLVVLILNFCGFKLLFYSWSRYLISIRYWRLLVKFSDIDFLILLKRNSW